jgi:mRNA interferase HigB
MNKVILAAAVHFSRFGKFALLSVLGSCLHQGMQVIAKRALRQFWERERLAEAPLRTWYALVSKAEWNSPADIRSTFGTADFVADNRVIFHIGGNKFRIVAHVAYKHKRVLIKFVGTHREYDAISPVKVGKP